MLSIFERIYEQLDMLKRFIHKFISILPPHARLLVEVAKVSVMDTVFNWRLPSYLVQGQLAGEGFHGSLVYFGEPHQYLSWSAMLFVDAKPPKPLGPVRLPDILRLKHGLSKNDLVLCPVNPMTEALFSQWGWFSIPRYVEYVIGLQKPIEVLFQSSNIKNEIKRLRRLKYSFKVLHSELALEEFYNEMLLPTVKKRHKERAYISRFENLKKKFENGYLLAAYRGSEWVGAELVVCQSNKTLRAANIGWRNGDERLMKDHINSALLLELIKRAKTEGFEFLNLGNSNPFVDDGPLNFKLKWEGELDIPRVKYEGRELQGVKGFLAAYINLTSESGRAMLHHNPLLEKHNGGMRAIGWNSTVPPTFKRQIEQGLPWVDLAKT